MSKKKKINIKVTLGMLSAFVLGTTIASITATYAAASLSSNNVYYDTTNSGGSSSTVSGAIDELYALASDQDILKAQILDLVYPVGSVYISTTDSTVAMVQERFGGTWVKYSSGTTLVGDDGTNYITNDTSKGSGGSKTVTLTTSNLPAHTHNVTASGSVSSSFKGSAVNSGTQSANHTHSIPALSGTALSAGAHVHTPASGSAYGFNLYVDGKAHRRSITTGTGTRYAITGDSVADDLMFNLTTSSAGAHTHSVTTVASTTGANSANHTHSVTAAGTVTSTFTGTKVTSTSTGSGTAVNVQDPYTVVYMYKRTA